MDVNSIFLIVQSKFTGKTVFASYHLKLSLLMLLKWLFLNICLISAARFL